jgi:low temperature requirement protein LtrA
LPAAFAAGLAFFGDVARGDAFFALFLMVFLVFLAALVMGAFFRFPLAFALGLAFLLVAITASWTLNSISKVQSLPNKKVSQRDQGIETMPLSSALHAARNIPRSHRRPLNALYARKNGNTPAGPHLSRPIGH